MNGKTGFNSNGPSTSGTQSGFPPNNRQPQMTPGAAINQLLYNKKHQGVNNGLPGASQANFTGSSYNGESTVVHRSNGINNGTASSVTSDDSFESETPSSVDVPSTSLGSAGSDMGSHDDGSRRGPGWIQPAFRPAPDIRLRNTNQLQFIKDTMNKVLLKHEHAWPFKAPVNAVELKIPDYHVIITNPMDLGTISKRLDHFYYRDAQQCVHDFKTMFANCYTYNTSGDIVVMANKLELAFLGMLRNLPAEEIEIPVDNYARQGKGRPGNKGKRGPGRPVGSGVKKPQLPPPTPLSQPSKHTQQPPSLQPPMAHAHVPNSAPNPVLSLPVSAPRNPPAAGNFLPPTAMAIERPVNPMTRPNFMAGRLPAPVPQVRKKAPAPPRNPAPLPAVRGPPPAFPRPVGPGRPPGPKIMAQNVAISPRIPLPVVYPPAPQPTRFTSPLPAIAIKKMTTTGSSVLEAIPAKGVNPLKVQMDYCYDILAELLSKQHLTVAWPFKDPVDAESLGLHDYHSIIKKPMDLTTVGRNFDSKKYKRPQEFAEDVRLIFYNCFRYNPEDHEVIQMAKQLCHIFEYLWSKLPYHLPPSPRIEREMKGELLFPTETGDEEPISQASTSSSRELAKPRKKKKVHASILEIQAQLAAFNEQLSRITSHPLDSEPPSKPKKPRKSKAETEESKPSKLASLMDDKKAAAAEAAVHKPKKSPKRPVPEADVYDMPASPPKRQKKPPAPKSAKTPDVVAVKSSPAKSPLALVAPPKEVLMPQQPQPVPVSIQQKKPSIPVPKPEMTSREFTFQQKQELSDKINSLQGEKLERVVQIIQELEVQYADAPEEIEIDFEALLPTTLCALEDFVNNALGIAKSQVPAAVVRKNTTPPAPVAPVDVAKPSTSQPVKERKRKFTSSSESSSDSDSSDSESDSEQKTKKLTTQQASVTPIDQPVFGGAPKMPPVFPQLNPLVHENKTFGNLVPASAGSGSKSPRTKAAPAPVMTPPVVQQVAPPAPTSTSAPLNNWSNFTKQSAAKQSTTPDVFQDSFEQFRRQAKEKEERERTLKKEQENKRAQKQTLERTQAKREQERASHREQEHELERTHRTHFHQASYAPPRHNMSNQNVPSPSNPFVFGHQPSPHAYPSPSSSSMSPNSASMSPSSQVASPPEAAPGSDRAERERRQRDRQVQAELRRQMAANPLVDLSHQHDLIQNFESQMY